VIRATGRVWLGIGLLFLLQGGLARSEPVTAEEMQELWKTLAGDDAAKAYRAIWKMVGAPQQSVPFLKEHLKPITPVDSEKLDQLIADLDSNRFAVRKKATEQLEKFAELAKQALKKAKDKNPSLEVRQRIEQILAKVEGPTITTPETLRSIRAVEVLEHIGSPEAQQVLQALAKGAPGATITDDAIKSLARLAKRVAKQP
jgi:hypothetical protein